MKTPEKQWFVVDHGNNDAKLRGPYAHSETANLMRSTMEDKESETRNLWVIFEESPKAEPQAKSEIDRLNPVACGAQYFGAMSVVFDGDYVRYSDYAETADKLREANAELLEALKYARRFLKPEDHDTAHVDGIIAKHSS